MVQNLQVQEKLKLQLTYFIRISKHMQIFFYDTFMMGDTFLFGMKPKKLLLMVNCQIHSITQ